MYSFAQGVVSFLKHCQYEKNLSPKTLKAYSTDLSQLAKFLSQNNFPLEINAISKRELKLYMEHISSCKPKTIKRKVAAIKTLFNYWEFEDLIQANPIRKIRISIKEPRALPKVMELKEIESIIKLAYERLNETKPNTYTHQEALRDIVVIELLFATGARVSEIANLKKDDINISTGSIIIRGKGNKERIIQICNQEVLKSLSSYCTAFANKIERSEYLLINRLGVKLSDQSIRNRIKQLAKYAGIQKHITPHVFRHSFATLLLEEDVDIKYIQSLLGHSSIMTTQIYTHVNREKQSQILRAKHPRRELHMFNRVTNAG